MLDAAGAALAEGAPVLAITGEEGHGKTSLIGPLRRVLGEDFTVGVLSSDPEGGEMQRILSAFAPTAAASSRLETRWALRDLLEGRRREGRPCVLIVDDAHRAPASVVSALEKLVGSSFDRRSTLRVVLLAPRTELGRSPMKALSFIEVPLGPLDPEKATEYVRHRLLTAGAPQGLFDEAAARELGSASGGVPDALDRLGAACLEAAVANGARRIDVDAVRAAARAARGEPLDGPGHEALSRAEPPAAVEAGPTAAATRLAQLWMPMGPDEFRFLSSPTPPSFGGERQTSAGSRAVAAARPPAASTVSVSPR